MQQQTQDLIADLKECASKDEGNTMVEKEQQIQNSLLKRSNLEFYPEEHLFPKYIF